MSNPITVVGTIATAPKRIVTQSGVVLCSFRVASGDRRYDREQGKWVDGETNWFGVTAFRSLAEHALDSLRKGERIVVFGRLRLRQWESGEKSGLSVEVEAEALGHDLRWGVSRFEKRVQAEPGAAGEPGTSGESGSVVGSETPEDTGMLPEERAGEERADDGFLPVAA
ncbi:MAG: single-stranded DNA-binding protein [Candidatus Leucobacter sulfamidivorax]|nr:single-stranded DNA-binding protein [Candidatus Leucobacter sulfamidivorax]